METKHHKEITNQQRRLKNSKSFFEKHPGWFPVCFELKPQQENFPPMKHNRIGFRGDVTLRGLLLYICRQTEGLDRCVPLRFVIGGEEYDWTNKSTLEFFYANFKDKSGYLHITYYFD